MSPSHEPSYAPVRVARQAPVAAPDVVPCMTLPFTRAGVLDAARAEADLIAAQRRLP